MVATYSPHLQAKELGMTATRQNHLIPSSLAKTVNVSHSVVTGRQNRYIGVRLVIERKKGVNNSLREVLTALDGFFSKMNGTVYVVPISFGLDPSLYEWDAPPNVILSIPAADIQVPQMQTLLKALYGNKQMRLAIDGRAENPVPGDMLEMFEYAFIREFEDRRRKRDVNAPRRPVRRIPFISMGDSSMDSVETALFGGAAAIVGWRYHLTRQQIDAKPLQPSQTAAVRLFKIINEETSIEEAESILALAPSVLTRFFQILRLSTNEQVEVTSLQEALDLFGYRGLIRFLAVLLLTSGRDFKKGPVIHAALMRGIFSERMSTGNDNHDDMTFLSGVFSLSDSATSIERNKLFEIISMPKVMLQLATTPTATQTARIQILDAVERADYTEMRHMCREIDAQEELVTNSVILAVLDCDRLLWDLQPT